MIRRFPVIPVMLAALILLLSPVAATVVLTGVSFAPEAPLVPGRQQQAVATFSVIPSGSTTFANGHTLQMQTGLSDARWTIQVTQNGRDAARQTATGSAAFVNGEILSYSTSNDVGLVVTIDGTVPQGAAGELAVLQVKELDNSGNAVPGSDLTVSQPVAGPETPPATSVLPTRTPSPATTAVPEKSAGPAALPCVLTVIIAGAIALRSSLQKQ